MTVFVFEQKTAYEMLISDGSSDVCSSDLPTLLAGLRQLPATPGILACRPSGFYRSAPVEAAGPDFINAVAAVDTTLAPLALLDALQALETRHGRLRPYKNAPRTLDLDLLLYGDRKSTRLNSSH